MSPKPPVRSAPCLALFVAAAILGAVCGCRNTAPSAPVLLGPDEALADSAATFRAVATDPDADSLAYEFDWGDSSELVWTDRVASGETISTTHTFARHDTFEVVVRARDRAGNLSDWSAPLSLIVAPGPYPWRLVKTIPVGHGAISPDAVSPDGRYLYAVGAYSTYVHVFRTSDDSVVAKLDMLDGMWSNSRNVAASPDGQYVYATQYSTRSYQIAVIRTSDFSVVDSVEVGDFLSGMSITPDGKWLAAGAEDERAMCVVSTQTHAVHTVSLPEESRHVKTVPSPDGSRVYACDVESDFIDVVSTVDWTVTDTIQFWAGYFPLLSPDGNYFYSTGIGEDTGVVAFSIPDKRVEWSVRLPRPEYPTAVSPDGEYVYGLMFTGSEEAQWFFVLRVADRTLVHTVELPHKGELYKIVLSPSGDRAYIPGRSEIYVVAR